ncbi:hypothetical protein CR513_35713, partial [Mucuna pruriens]
HRERSSTKIYYKIILGNFCLYFFHFVLLFMVDHLSMVMATDGVDSQYDEKSNAYSFNKEEIKVTKITQLDSLC